MRTKKVGKTTTTPVRKKRTKKQEDVQDKATPSTENIAKYLTSKGEEEKTKLTFTSTSVKKNVNVRERIEKFQNMNRRNSCVKSSGRCSTHKCALVREIVNKKMSKINKDGKLGWTIGEVTILSCPQSQSQVNSTEINRESVTQPTRLGEPANKKLKEILCKEMTQSEKQ